MPLQPDLEDIVKACCIVKSNRPGTGYLISETLIVTCEHVVSGCIKGQIINVVFSGKDCETKLEDSNEDTDCALLILTEPLTSIKPLHLSTETIRSGCYWEAYGFPAATNQQGDKQTGSVKIPLGTDQDGKEALVLFSCQLAAAEGDPGPGFSGSPVLVDGKIIGHLRSVLGRKDLKSGELAKDSHGNWSAMWGTWYATPAKNIRSLIERLSIEQRKGVKIKKSNAPEILIIHNSKTKEEFSFIEIIEDQLENSSFNTILRLVENEKNWRIKLIEDFGYCDAAILLVNKESLSNLEMLLSEISILRWRNWVDSAPLFLVFFDTDTKELFLKKQQIIQEKKYELHLYPLSFWLNFSQNEIFCGDLQELLNSLNIFKLSQENKIPKTVKVKEDSLELCLKKILNNGIENASETVLENFLAKRTTYKWRDNPSTQLKRLTRELMWQGLDLFDYLDELDDTSKLTQSIRKFVITSKVDLRVAGLIAKASAKRECHNVFAISASTEKVGISYISQAYYDVYGSFNKRKIITVIIDSNKSILQQKEDVTNGLLKTWSDLSIKYNKCKNSDKIEGINNRLLEREKDKNLTFLLLAQTSLIAEDSMAEDSISKDSISKELLEYIKEKYPTLVVILLIGCQNKELPYPEIDFLETNFCKMDETIFCSLFTE